MSTVCAVGCHSEAVGHSAVYSAAYVVQSPAVSDVCVCAVGCHSEAVGHSAGYSAVYVVQSPAVSEVCALGWNRPYLLLITGQHHQSLACC